MNIRISQSWWPAFAAMALIASSSAAEESAVQEVRQDIEKLGMTEEFNPATEEIVGVGSVFASVDLAAAGWEEKYVEMVTTARLKAAMEVSKVLSANLSAARAVESSSRENSRYKATARVIKMRTEGNPVGCRLIARRQKVSQGKIQVAVALKWSVKLEAETVGAFTHPQAVAEEDLEKWASQQDLVSMVGPCFWSDGKGRSCFLGVGAAEIKGEGSLAIKNAKRMANIRARRYVAYSFLETLTAQEEVSKTSFRKTFDDETVAKAESSYSYTIRSRAKGLMLPGMVQVYSAMNVESPFTHKRMCVSVYALPSAQVKDEIQGKLIDE